MENCMKDKVLTKTDEIIEYIKNTSEYKRYNLLKEEIYNNKEIMILIEAIKALQKKAVKEESLGKSSKYIDQEIEEKLQVLNSNPLYSEFTYLQEDLNETFQEIKFIIEKNINDKIN